MGLVKTYMNEQTEIKIKTQLLNFIKGNFVFEGDPNLVQKKLYDLTEELYGIFLNINGIVDKKDLDNGSGVTIPA